jgi:hypothetical protein
MSRRISADQLRQILEVSMKLQSGCSDVLFEAKQLEIIGRFNRRYKDLSFEEADRLLAWLIKTAEEDPDLKAREAGAR